MRPTLLLLVFAFSVTALAQFPTTCTVGAPHFSDKSAPTADTIDLKGQGCPTTGLPPATFTADQKKAEEAQNSTKNNFCAQGPAQVIKILDMFKLQASVTTQKLVKPKEPPVDRSGLVKLGEGQQVQFVGFVFEARQEGGESVNCGDAVPDVPASHDIHIALIEHARTTNPDDKTTQGKAKADAEECGSIVAEMSPHHRIAPWNAENLTAIANLKLPVRVTGQRFFDGSHVPCSNGKPVASQPKRISLWEIHPIYSFEVCPSKTCTDTGWQPIETFCATAGNCDVKKPIQ
jgi:hypothetical protein